MAGTVRLKKFNFRTAIFLKIDKYKKSCLNFAFLKININDTIFCYRMQALNILPVRVTIINISAEKQNCDVILDCLFLRFTKFISVFI